MVELTMRWGGKPVLDQVNLTVQPGERLLLLYEGQFRWQGSVQDFHQSHNPYVVQFRTGSLSGPMQPAEL